MAEQQDGTRTTIFNLVIETFFAVLPLIVLGGFWKPAEGTHESFWTGPELSMTSCILYGLTLAKLLQGAVFAVSHIRTDDTDSDIHEVAAGYAVLFLFPLLGLILSLILISKSMQGVKTGLFIVLCNLNLTFGIGTFFWLGGRGMKEIEGGEER